MKKCALFLLAPVLLSITNRVLAQGSLTPPGAPGPTMITLSQVEPRTIVNAANTPGDSGDTFIISQPGSYYLATNLVGVSGQNGIEITANNVTLDLTGFTLQGVSGSSDGIHIPNTQTNITVRNGAVTGWGNNGVLSSSASSANMVFERLNFSANGNGIVLAGTGVVRDCNSQNNFETGISCNGGMVSDCTANYNDGDGIEVSGGSISGCTANNNAGGFYCVAGNASGCFAQSNTVFGIFEGGSGYEIVGNTCNANNQGAILGYGGIVIYGSNNRIDGNHVAGNGYAGIVVQSSYTNNVIIKNSVSGDGANNYSVSSGNDLGPVGTATNATSPWANISH